MTPHISLTHAFFDLDGTLVDSLPGISLSANTAIAQTLSRRNSVDLRPFIGPKIRDVFQRAFAIEDPEVLIQLERAFRSHYDKEGLKLTVAYPGVSKTLGALRRLGVRCCVLTNKPMYATIAILQHLSLDGFFAEIFTPDRSSPPYTSKIESALHAKHHCGLKGSDAIMIGDSTDDKDAAEACGFRFGAVEFGYGLAYHKISGPSSYRIERFEDVVSLVESMQGSPNLH